MITPDLERLISIHESEKAEEDALKAREDLLLMLETRGWQRFQQWLSEKRDNAFQQLRGVRGTRDVMAESFLRWQTVDAMYEDIQYFITHTMEQADDILRRRAANAQEQFIKENYAGFTHDPADAGTSGSGDERNIADAGY